MRRHLLCLSIVVLLTACASGSHRPATDRPRVHESPVLVEIIGQNELIIVRASERGPVYTVEALDGRILVPAMTLNELRAQHPRVYERVVEMRAAAATIWAGLPESP